MIESLIKPFYFWDKDTLVVNILGTPSAKRNKIGKIKGNQLKVSVTAAPEKGKATSVMVRFLAKEFGVKQSAIEVVYGDMNINKQLRVNAPKKLPNIFTDYKT
ncbi:MAG: DUF167 domain-containing protein [Pseudomonadota bacterium]